MPLSLTRTIGPVIEPVTVPEIKQFLRIESQDDDALLAMLIAVARDAMETVLQRTLLTSTYTLSLDEWPGQDQWDRARRDWWLSVIRLPRPPTQAVTSITYYDSAGTQQTWASSNYFVDVQSEPARVWPAPSSTWPDLAPGRLNAITVTYTAGWTTATAIPETLRHLVRLLVGELYERRESQMESGYGISKIEENPTYLRLLRLGRMIELR